MNPERSYSVEEATSATKTDTSILRTPASIQVIARTVLDDKQALSMPDAVNGHVSGVLGRTGGGFLYDNFIIRGFSVSEA
ncbi:MAG: TonB-dependent receptor plug domain-containing protein [Burkholderiaceae bacterium]|nr:TonB-dependent receptor plug domain-containing protein [Burkholderiaceae bacterium]